MAQKIIYKALGTFDTDKLDQLRAWEGVSSVDNISGGVMLKLNAEPKDMREIAQLRARQLLGIEPDYQGFEG